MSENKKTRCISKIKIRTILGLQHKKSVQSVHFGHPAIMDDNHGNENHG